MKLPNLRIFWNIYRMPLKGILVIMAASLLVWTVLMWLLRRRQGWNRVLAGLMTAGILPAIIHVTLNRRPGARELYLLPFQLFIRARVQPEYYRAALMNVFLFFPLGLGLPILLCGRRKHPVRDAIAAAALLSAAVELCQLVFGLGSCETDDILANTLGAAIGCLACLPYCRSSKPE